MIWTISMADSQSRGKKKKDEQTEEAASEDDDDGGFKGHINDPEGSRPQILSAPAPNPESQNVGTVVPPSRDMDGQEVVVRRVREGGVAERQDTAADEEEDRESGLYVTL